MSGFRGLVHVHSEFSYDSTTPLESLKALAMSRGLSFIVQTEHSNRMTAADHARYVREARALREPGFLMAPGVEYATSDNRIHVLVLGVEEFWDDLHLCPPDRISLLLDRVRASGGLAVLAHPERANAIDHVDPQVLQRFDAIEVWNGKTDRFGPSPRSMLEIIRRRRNGTPVPALVGLDLHRVEDYRPVGIEVERMPTDESELYALIREGRFRAFLGPVRWDPSNCGPVAVAVGRASRTFVTAARALKRGAGRFARKGER